VLADEVMVEWLDLIRARCPWSDMPLDDMTGGFRAVFEELLEPRAELAPNPRAARLRWASRVHGAFRRRQGCPPPVLREEILLAEEAIEIALERVGAPPAVVLVIQESLVAVLRSIERAAYGGYVDCMERPSSGL